MYGCGFVVAPGRNPDTCTPTEFILINEFLTTVVLEHMRLFSRKSIRLKIPDEQNDIESWNRMFATQPPVRIKTIRDIINDRESYERRSGWELIPHGSGLVSYVWIDGYSVGVNKFWLSIERRGKQRAEKVAKGEIWRADDEDMVLKQRAKIFSCLPHDYSQM